MGGGGWRREWSLTCLSPQTGKVLGKGPVLQLHNLNREAGGGYRCVASVPSVPGLNSTQLVNVAILGEALWAQIRWPLEPPKVGCFKFFEDIKPLTTLECSMGRGK